jgi:GTPase SAR1 family protein
MIEKLFKTFNHLIKNKMDFDPPKRDLFLDINPDKAYSIALIGQTRSGKSFLLNHLMERYFSKKINILMTDSPNAEIYKEGFFKGKDIIKSPKYLPQIMRMCYKINKGTDNKYDFCFVLDDIVDKKQDKELIKCHTIYRNSKISCVITGQKMTILNPVCRANTNFVFLGRLGNDGEIEDNIKAFLQTFYPKSYTMYDKIQAYKEHTKNYHFYCIDNINGDIFITKVKP